MFSRALDEQIDEIPQVLNQVQGPAVMLIELIWEIFANCIEYKGQDIRPERHELLTGTIDAVYHLKLLMSMTESQYIPRLCNDFLCSVQNLIWDAAPFKTNLRKHQM